MKISGDGGDKKTSVGIVSFDDIERLGILKRFQEHLHLLTGLVFDFADTEGKSSPRLNAAKKFTDFCSLVNSTPGGAKDCRDCDVRAWERCTKSRKPMVYSCHLGLKEICVPLELHGHLLGFLISGQFLLSRPTKAGYDLISNKIVKYGINRPKAAKAYRSLPVIGKKKAEAIMGLISIISEYIIESENKIIELKNAFCKDRMQHAREFIKLNYKKQIYLKDVAVTVLLSPSRFAHIFKERFGVTFTSYINELRINEAKNLLSNTDLKIIEIAFQSGFRNVSHFNHVFKRKAGSSPSKYRKQHAIAK